MQIAQKLYEDGLITYMRTDAVNLSKEAIAACREVIGKYFGDAYLPKTPKEYKTKSKNAQGGARGDPPVRRNQHA